MPFDAHPPALRSKVIGEFLQGVPKKKLARDNNISVATVRRWCDAATGLHGTTFQQAQADNVLQKGEKFHVPEPEMVDLWTPVFDLVTDLLRSASAVSKVWEIPGWLDRQNAHELGLFLSITVDKGSAILEALERGYELKRQAQAAGLTGLPSGVGEGGDRALGAPVGSH